MFGILKAAIEVVKIPVDLAADVCTLGNSMGGDAHNDKPYTQQRLERVMDKLNED